MFVLVQKQLENHAQEVQAAADQEKAIAQKFSEMDEAYKSKVTRGL